MSSLSRISRLLLLLSIVAGAGSLYGQGRLQGSIVSANGNSVLAGATVDLRLHGLHGDSGLRRMAVTDAQGEFAIDGLPFGWYVVQISSSGHDPLTVDSLHIRPDKPILLLNDLVLSIHTTGLETIVIHAEKPLLESKDGNIVFNATESPLSAGSNASELLRNIPLVAQDPDGKVTVRGREPRILIDDKPVEMSARQMQDFLESLPGSMIEKIEVMTNPPAQYANEPGGVINIVTRKGRTGWNARINATGGSRGETALNGHAGLRRKDLSIQFTAGTGYSRVLGQSEYVRTNRFPDSTNRLLTSNGSDNISWRPLARLAIDQDIDARNILSAAVQFNAHRYRNANQIGYRNENRNGQVYRSSLRQVANDGDNINPDVSLSYIRKGRLKGEQLRFNGSSAYSGTDGLRDFRQSFFNALRQPLAGGDSAQQQDETTISRSLSLRLAYDKPIVPERTILSTAAAFIRNATHVDLQSFDLPSAGASKTPRSSLSNVFDFRQDILAGTLSLRQRLAERFWATTGVTYESTSILFDLIRDAKEVRNGYENWLPFANISRYWNRKSSLSLVYRATLRRPGIRELNPTIDYTDPYNLRFGNASLLPSPTHSIDLNFGRTLERFQMNAGIGYNRVDDIFATVRTLQDDGRTYITWQNISGREEFEANGWMNLNLSGGFRMNANANYSYNRYSSRDILVNRYRNAASINGRVNLTYAPKPQVWNTTASIGLNRYANPQGTVRSTVNMVFGAQYRFLKRRFIVTAQAVDPFIQQEYRTLTEGVNFRTEGFSLSRTRNYRLTLGYNMSGSLGSGRRVNRALPPERSRG
jgi:outer membrane receptor protein involved in Fe transport